MAQIISFAEKRATKQSHRMAEEATILRRIDQIADRLGIDVEAPFRRRVPVKLGERKPPPKGGGTHG